MILVFTCEADSISGIESAVKGLTAQRREKYDSAPEKDKALALAAGLCFDAARRRAGIPDETNYALNEYGKPVFEGFGCDLSLTHSGLLAACAISCDGAAVGLDCELIRPARCESIARRMFSPAETELILSSHENERQRVFFDIWTKKESYIKLLGTGLRTQLKSFDVTDPDSLGIFFTGLGIAPGYACSLCSDISSGVEVIKI
ncbi:MAG: 4'-phosphopantetheinyl transferase superfamily protein [Clostridia bacterium]|nr:4'-phosphopantetheinyl transferase superfamily protein [Clostridia bacterium]